MSKCELLAFKQHSDPILAHGPAGAARKLDDLALRHLGRHEGYWVNVVHTIRHILGQCRDYRATHTK